MSEKFPAVGVYPYQIYRVGTCKLCEIPLFSYTPEERTVCGACVAMTLEEPDDDSLD